MLTEKFKNFSIILASQSPRRQSLLEGLDIPFIVRTRPDIDESFPDSMENTKVAQYLAGLKFNEYLNDLKTNEFMITADTTVCIDSEILNKPKDRSDAIRMLQRLSGNKHTVVTGVCIGTLKKRITFTSESEVYFKTLSDEEIIYYVDKYKPFDKAGAYGVQEWIGYVAITRIEGSYFNVMGLPIQKLYEELLNFDLEN